MWLYKEQLLAKLKTPFNQSPCADKIFNVYGASKILKANLIL
jgi:hypothetical protein